MRSATEPTQAEIERVISGLRVRKWTGGKGDRHAIADCVAPGCANPKEHLYVNAETGKWDCKRCGEAGSLWSLATHMGLKLRERSMVRSTHSVLMTSPKVSNIVKTIPREKIERSHARLFNAEDADGKATLDYLHGRGFDDETLQRFQVGAVQIVEEGKQEPAVGIPYFHDGKPALLKMRNLSTDKEHRKFRRFPNGAQSLLFNEDAIKGRAQVVLVEGEMDAMSLYQLGVPNVASTSLGAKKDLPVEWTEILSQADDIVLWYDEDDVGQDAVACLVEKLGSHRCRIARIPDSLSELVQRDHGFRPKDANDLLRAKVEPESIAWIIEHAQGVVNTSVVEVGAFADALQAEVMRGEESLGVSTGWASLDNLLRGWRTKELTVVTGHTSHGKSTWATEAMERICRIHQEPVMMSALENGPITVARKMLHREYGMPLSSIKTVEDQTKAISCIESISKLPVFVLDLYGRQRVDAIAEAMLYARKRLGVKFAMIDHLHFFAKEDNRQDDREFIDQTAMRLVSLTRELDMHIMLLCHPRGSVELNVLPSGDAVKGSSTIKQVADNGITVYRSTDALGESKPREVSLKDMSGKRIKVHMGQNSSLLYVWKARHDDAREGACILEFTPRGLRFESDRMASEKPQEKQDPFTQGDNNTEGESAYVQD